MISLLYVPEVPIRESWEWLTDILPSYNGEEQRISLRGSTPRYRLTLDYKISKQSDLRKFSEQLLTARGKADVPEYQFFTRTTQGSNSGTSRLYFDPAQTDIRQGEKLYVEELGVYTVSTLETDGATLTTNLSSNVGKNTLVCPIHTMIFKDVPSFNRYAVNDFAEFSISGIYNKKRNSLIRPGSSYSLTMWNSVPVLDVRPLSNNDSENSILEDNVLIDNKISSITLINRWEESKVKISKQYLIERRPSNCTSEIIRSFDYWRHFLSYCRGSAKKFWLPTYRPDLKIVQNPSSGDSSILVEGFGYGQTIFPNKETHKYLEIKTAQGTHRCTVQTVGSEGLNTRCNFTPALPSGWVDVERVSYLLPVRLEGDSVEWEHSHLTSILNLSVRTAENE